MPRKKKPKVKYQTYLFDITGSEMDYDFSLNERDKYFRGPFWEYMSISIEATAYFPERIKGDKFMIYVMGARDLDVRLDAPEEDLSDPLGVGELTARADYKHFFGAIPRSDFWEIERRIKEGQLKAINLHGQTLRYGSAKIRSIAFAKEFNPEEY